MTFTIIIFHDKLLENNSEWNKVENNADIESSQHLVEESSTFVKEWSITESKVC